MPQGSIAWAAGAALRLSAMTMRSIITELHRLASRVKIDRQFSAPAHFLAQRQFDRQHLHRLPARHSDGDR